MSGHGPPGAEAFAETTLDAGRLRELTRSDLDALQTLLERCEDFHRLHFGGPPSATAARDEWDDVPPGVARSHKHVIGLLDPQLAGVAEVVRDWPRAATWHIGLLLLEPAARGRGTGAQVMRAIDAWAARSGADRLRIAVNRHNERGVAFWERLGFVEVPPFFPVPGDTTRFALERAVRGGA